jgi:lipid-A-disaccharide synthase-like uncharacterized protein
MPIEPSLAWQLASTAGLLCLVLAYLVNQSGRCRADDRRYLLANALGAGMLGAYSLKIDEPIFVVLEGFWCVASLYAMTRTRRPGESAA